METRTDPLTFADADATFRQRAAVRRRGSGDAPSIVVFQARWFS